MKKPASKRLVHAWRDVDVVGALGLEKMRAILTEFYDRLFDDLLIGFFFRGRDKARLIERQLQFTARAFGADIAYTGASVPEAHDKLPPILPGHFDRRHQLLRMTLEQHGVSDEIKDAWLAFDRSFSRAVITKSDR